MSLVIYYVLRFLLFSCGRLIVCKGKLMGSLIYKLKKKDVAMFYLI